MRSSSPNCSERSCGRCRPSTVSAVAIRPTTARAGVGAAVGEAAGGSVGSGECVAGAVVGRGEGDGDATGDAAGEGLGDSGSGVAVLGGAVGSSLDGGCACVVGAGAAVSATVGVTRGAATSGAATAGEAVCATATGEGLSVLGGGCVGTSTLVGATGSPLHAAMRARTSTRHTPQTVALAQDLAREVQRRTMALNSRRSIYRASGSDSPKEP